MYNIGIIIKHLLFIITLAVYAVANTVYAETPPVEVDLKPEGTYNMKLELEPSLLVGKLTFHERDGVIPLDRTYIYDKNGNRLNSIGGNNPCITIECNSNNKLHLYYVYQRASDTPIKYKLFILMDYEPVAFMVDNSPKPLSSYTFIASPRSVRAIPITLPYPKQETKYHDVILLMFELTNDAANIDMLTKRHEVDIIQLESKQCKQGVPNIPTYSLLTNSRKLTFTEGLKLGLSSGMWIGMAIDKLPLISWNTVDLVAKSGSTSTININIVSSNDGQWVGLLFLDDNVLPSSPEQSAVYWKSKKGYLNTVQLPVHFPLKKGIHTLTWLVFSQPYQPTATIWYPGFRQYQMILN